MKRKTNKKKLAKKSREINALIRDMRNLPIRKMVKKLNEILVGYYHYYGITDNSASLNSFQRKSYTKDGYKELVKQFPLALPRIYVSIYR